MSTDHQKYSTENQLDTIRRYAEQRGYTIVRVFEDSGRSGLRMDGREGLQSLMREVQSGTAGFQAILVYDVSRWGRFQDADEGAYHEHICSRAGIRVHYCGEQFDNDGSIGSILLKNVKRVMAGEYSRELSVKVFAGQCRLIEHGFRQGGPAGFGLRRLLIDEGLMILRYSATHRTQHNRVHRLDALDAYNQKLVKKIAVRGIQTRGLAGTNAYLFLEGIDISKKAPVARIELEVKLKSGEIKRQLRRLEFRDDLFTVSGELDQYRGFAISQIDYNHDTVEFTNGVMLTAGEATGDVSERDIRRIQIRETIKAHFDKEKQLFAQGIKVLSLFFIDEVVKYRDYDQVDEKGEYARAFEEEYELLKAEYLSELAIDNEAYRKHLAAIDVTKTHNGYFSIDKKTNRLKNPEVGARAVDSDDVDAYDLILKDKES